MNTPAESYITPQGVDDSAAYVTQRKEDAAKLKAELDAAFDGGAKRGRYQRTPWLECTASMYQGQVFVACNWNCPHPFTVITGNTYYRVKTEAQVLAYILARFW